MTRSVRELEQDLRALGVREGDTIMVHASLRAIGPVEGGARGVIEALDAAVSTSGTTMMVLGARDDWAWVNERPEPERAALLEGAEPFDALRTPAEPDVGWLAEVLRTTPGTRVSDHPEGRFAARGARADDLLRAVPWNDYYGPDSPLERLHEIGGRVLRLGADESTVTLFHYAEYLVELPNKRRVRRWRRVLECGQPVIRTVECLDDADGIVEWKGAWEGEDYFALLLRAYLATGRGLRGTVGGARSELLDARDLVAFAVRWMREHLAAR